jgi:PAS domain S-box-containing protein
MGTLAKLLPTALRRWLLTSLGGASEDWFARVFHTSPDWIVITRLEDSLIVEANQGFQTISGYSPSEVIGRRMADFQVWAHPEQRARIVEELKRTGFVRDTLVQARRRDGSIRDCVLNATLLARPGEAASHVVWVSRDVTDQNALNEQFKAAFQLTPDFMSISRLRDGRYVEVNAAFERLTGLSRDQVIGKTATEVGVWHDPQERDALVQAIMAAGTISGYSIRTNGRNGQVRESLVNAAIFESRGEPYMIALLRDVTDARAAARALQESEARFSSLFDQSPIPMSYASDSDNFATVHWNQAWFDLFGFDPETSQGKPGLELGIWVQAQDRVNWLDNAIAGKNTTDTELQLRRADGTLRWVSLSSRTLVEQQRTLVLFTYFDITERRRAQQEILELNTQLEARVAQRTTELQNSNQELSHTLATLGMAQNQLVQSEKLAALGALVAGVAHELNTPIGNGLTVASALEHRVQQFAPLLDAGMKRSDLQTFVDDARLAADILVRNLTRAGALVASFKQVAIDQTSSQRRRFSLSAVVSEILVTLSPAIRASACVVTTDIDASLSLDSYPGPLGQVLTNLINNAIVHGFGPGEAGTITLGAQALDADRIVVQVSDSGRGIQAQDLLHVFEPFFTTRLGQGGSGLGLHIVHNIVTGVLGGQIEARSLPGQGATFILNLPRTAPERSSQVQPALMDG